MTAPRQDEPLLIALPSKGRLQENAFAFFARAGLALVQSRGARDYRGAIEGVKDVEVLFLSASEIARELGVIDFWFMASGKRIHKTVHHYLFREVGGHLAPQITEVDEVRWFPLTEIVEMLAYPDEKKLIARSGELKA